MSTTHTSAPSATGPRGPGRRPRALRGRAGPARTARALGAALAATLLAVVAVQVGPVEVDAAPDEVAPVAWSPCGEGDCATYRVPLDHRDPDGPEISLALWRARATGDPADRIGTLFVNPGGPGSPGIAFAEMAVDVVSPQIRERFDIVGFDPRGIGASSPTVDCAGDDDELAPDGDWAAYFQAKAVASGPVDTACSIATGRLRDLVGTNQVVADLDLLRRAVGDEGLTYWGGSYGTRIGYTYAATYPESVRAIVLDGPVDPASDAVSFMHERGGSYDVAWHFFRDRNPGTAASIDAVSAALDAGPATLTVDGTEVVVDQTTFVLQIYSSLSSEDAWGAIVDYVAAVERNVVDAVDDDVVSPPDDLVPDLDQAELQPAAGSAGRNSETALRNVNCVDLAPRATDLSARAAEMVAAGPLFGGLMAQGLDMCDHFPVTVDLIPDHMAPSVPPLLIIGSEHDPATPYVWAQRMRAAVPGSRLVTYGGGAHVAWNFTASSCVDDAADAYVLDLVLPASDTSCPFVAPAGT